MKCPRAVLCLGDYVLSGIGEVLLAFTGDKCYGLVWSGLGSEW